MKRVLVATMTTALLGFVPIAVSGPAHAEPAVSAVTTASAQDSVQAEARQKRKVTFFGRQQGNSNRFFVFGKVSPNYKNRVVLIRQAKGAESTNFKAFKRIKTNRQGQYRTRVAVPARSGASLRYIALVPQSGNFNATRSKRVYTITRG